MPQQLHASASRQPCYLHTASRQHCRLYIASRQRQTSFTIRPNVSWQPSGSPYSQPAAATLDRVLSESTTLRCFLAAEPSLRQASTALCCFCVASPQQHTLAPPAALLTSTASNTVLPTSSTFLINTSPVLFLASIACQPYLPEHCQHHVPSCRITYLPKSQPCIASLPAPHQLHSTVPTTLSTPLLPACSSAS